MESMSTSVIIQFDTYLLDIYWLELRYSFRKLTSENQMGITIAPCKAPFNATDP